jgi:hypothetical protein
VLGKALNFAWPVKSLRITGSRLSYLLFLVAKKLMKQRSVVFIFISLLLWSCSHVVKLPPPKTPLFKRYPFSIVLYQNQAFKNYIHIFGAIGSFRSSMDLGTPSSLILIETLKSMFERVLLVDNIIAVPKNYDGILEPEIIGIGGYDIVEITYRFILYDKNEHIVKDFKITGKDNSGSWIVSTGTGPAIQDAMAQLMIMFQDDPKIQEWLFANKVEWSSEDPNHD